MKKQNYLFLTIILIVFTSNNAVTQEIDKYSEIKIENKRFQDLDGAFTVARVDENGESQQFNVKFNNGKIISIAINGEELPREQWVKNEKLITEYISYILPDEQKSYKHKSVYYLENDLKNDFDKLEKTIQELEISKRFEKFYNEELKQWMDNLEKELNKSEFFNEMEGILNELSKELDRFLEERKSYSKSACERECKSRGNQ